MKSYHRILAEFVGCCQKALETESTTATPNDHSIAPGPLADLLIRATTEFELRRRENRFELLEVEA